MTDKNLLILVVEDEKPIRTFITVSLKAQGYACINAENGRTALSMIATHNPDLIILDLGLGDMDGLDVIRQVRSHAITPIIVVSARDLDREKAEALDLGADDYLSKPFSVTELLARVRVAHRHMTLIKASAEEPQNTFKVAELLIDYINRRVFIRDNEIHLTPLEYNLMVLMSLHAGKVLTHTFILKEIWGTFSGSDTQSLRVFMANIRRKIEINPASPRYIITEVGIGYRMVDE